MWPISVKRWKPVWIRTCVCDMQKTWGDQMAWLAMWNYMKVAFQLTVQTIPVCFFFCLLPSSSFLSPFMLFSYLVAPLPVLLFQEAKMFRCWCPYNIFQPLILIAPLIDVFFVFLCKKFLAISHNFELRRVHFCKSGSFQRPRFTAIGGYLKMQVLGIFAK